MTIAPAVTIDTLERIRSIVRVAPASPPLDPIGLQEIVTGPAAAATVGEILVRLGVPDGATAILSDATPKSDGGDGDVVDVVIAALVAGQHPHRVVLHPSTGIGDVHADEVTLEHAVAGVQAISPACLVTVGSGTMADIGKVVAQRLDLVHVIVQTAASVNGFTDNQSVLLINGAKRTTPSRWPTALVVDSGVLARAPLAMTRSGLGDQLSMFTAAADWYLACAVGFDTSYSPVLVHFMREGSAALTDAADDLGQGRADAVLTLADALARGGLSMGIAGRTAPSSGAEHTISHLLEMHADAHGLPSASHGAQVGVASVVAAAIWRRVRRRLAEGGVRVRPAEELQEQAMHARVRSAFASLDQDGATGEECWNAYRRKLTWTTLHRDRIQQLCDTWAGHDPIVADLLEDPRVLAGTLHRAGAAGRFADLTPAPDRGTVSWALQHCHLMRDRFTVVDLADLIGLWTPHEVDAVLDEAQEATQWQ